VITVLETSHQPPRVPHPFDLIAGMMFGEQYRSRSSSAHPTGEQYGSRSSSAHPINNQVSHNRLAVILVLTVLKEALRSSLTHYLVTRYSAVKHLALDRSVACLAVRPTLRTVSNSQILRYPSPRSSKLYFLIRLTLRFNKNSSLQSKASTATASNRTVCVSGCKDGQDGQGLERLVYWPFHHSISPAADIFTTNAHI
jgi:hypothetical protein